MKRAEFEDEQETLGRIASTLLALAVLAAFLCVLPLRIRVAVLSLLRPAEAVARGFALDFAGGALALPPAVAPGPDGDGRGEALRLARCFRVLAAVFGGLQALAAAGRRLWRGGVVERLAQVAAATGWRNILINARRATACCAAGRFDTS